MLDVSFPTFSLCPCRLIPDAFLSNHISSFVLESSDRGSFHPSWIWDRTFSSIHHIPQRHFCSLQSSKDGRQDCLKIIPGVSVFGGNDSRGFFEYRKGFSFLSVSIFQVGSFYPPMCLLNYFSVIMWKGSGHRGLFHFVE